MQHDCVGKVDMPLKLTASFLKNRFQRVVLNNPTTKWSSVNAGVPQRSILGPFLCLSSEMNYTKQKKILHVLQNILSDDTLVFSVVYKPK